MGLKGLIVDVLGSALLRDTSHQKECDEALLKGMSLSSLTAEIGRREKEDEDVRDSKDLSGSFSGYAIKDNKREALWRAKDVFREKFQDEVKREVERQLKDKK